MKKIRAIILAAGKGTRMKSDVPKVLHKVCGAPLIQYVFDIVKAVGCEKSYVVIGYKGKDVKAFLPFAKLKGLAAVEQKKLLGTADAVKCCAGSLKNYRGDILILCGDTPLLSEGVIKNLVKRHQAVKASCTVLTALVSNPFGYGRIIRNGDGEITAIREEKDAADSERKINEINVGVYCFRSGDLFAALKNVQKNLKKKEFYLTDTVDLLNRQGLKVETYKTQDAAEGLGINSREDLAFAEAIIRRQTLRRFMLEGVTIIDPDTTFIDSKVSIGQDTVIRPFTVIENNVKIGRRCLIGPFTRLRPGTNIADEVEIGNFAEVSRTKIGSKTLMKHFSFLGDTHVGSKVNIGAGTVTANYDGKNKNMTFIDDGAFIGSDSIIVAPVRIGKKAIVGAGSVVVRKNIPAGTVAVGVPAIVRKGKVR